MNPFLSLRNYEEFIYTLRQRHESVLTSTLILIRRGRLTAVLQGEVLFDKGFRLSIRERLAGDGESIIIESYGYEIWEFDEKIIWYDSQPHPDEPHLSSTFPHHKHVHPNIRSNRVPAPNMNFREPNVPTLIQEIESLIKNKI